MKLDAGLNTFIFTVGGSLDDGVIWFLLQTWFFVLKWKSPSHAGAVGNVAEREPWKVRVNVVKRTPLYYLTFSSFFCEKRWRCQSPLVHTLSCTRVGSQRRSMAMIPCPCFAPAASDFLKTSLVIKQQKEIWETFFSPLKQSTEWSSTADSV